MSRKRAITEAAKINRFWSKYGLKAHARAHHVPGSDGRDVWEVTSKLRNGLPPGAPKSLSKQLNW